MAVLPKTVQIIRLPSFVREIHISGGGGAVPTTGQIWPRN